MTEQTKEQTPFHIGSYYRNGFGARGCLESVGGKAYFVTALSKTRIGPMGLDGRCIGYGESGLDLIPGECDESGHPLEAQDEGAWVMVDSLSGPVPVPAPTFYVTAETLKPAESAEWTKVDPVMEMLRRDAERLCGITHAQQKAMQQARNAELSRAVEHLAAIGKRRAEQESAEKLRPRLTWADSKPFDNFDGYEVTKRRVLGAGPNEHMGNDPTQRIASASAQPDPGHALAAVRQLVR